MDNCFTVIVVEDEELILNDIIKKIDIIGLPYKVIGTAEDGESALELIRQSPPDVLLTDIIIPVMDGLELVDNVNYYYPSVKKIIISGYSDFAYAKRAICSDVFDYLLKPVKQQELTDCLTRLLLILQSERASFAAIPECSDMKTSIQNIKLYIKENYYKEINVNTIAELFNLSPGYLSKMFMKYEKTTPSKYLINIRINEAKRLLQNKELSVKSIGELVGYLDQFYFSRIFKVVTGMSPGAFRNGL